MEGSGLGIYCCMGGKTLGAVIQQSAGLTLVPKYIPRTHSSKLPNLRMYRRDGTPRQPPLMPYPITIVYSVATARVMR
jgi:hypothetical protein